MKFRTITEAAKILGVGESRMRRAIAAGDIPSMKLGNRTVVDVDAVADLLERPKGVSIQTVSDETGLSVSAIRRGIREGWIPYDKPGGIYYFQMDDVRAAIEARCREQMKQKAK